MCRISFSETVITVFITTKQYYKIIYKEEFRHPKNLGATQNATRFQRARVIKPQFALHTFHQMHN